ncbi:hypothetical protein ACWDAZ_38140 [Streptomyces sp. NPDC001215]
MKAPAVTPANDSRADRAETAPQPAQRLPFWVNQRLGLLMLTVALAALFGVLRPAFLDQRLVLFPLLRDISTLTVVALAQMVVAAYTGAN